MLFWSACVTSAVKYLCLKTIYRLLADDGEKETKLFQKFPKMYPIQ